MSKHSIWWKQPQTIISILVGLTALFSWVANSIIADAKQSAKIEETSKKLEEIDDTVKDQDNQLEQAQLQYSLIQKDIAAIEKSQQQILEALKSKR